MAKGKLDVVVENGKSRSFAAVVAWPGWCRSGKGEEAALETLETYADRYARAIGGTKLGLPTNFDLVVVDTKPGDATTDFGAPSIIFDVDRETPKSKELDRLKAVLRASWSRLDRIAKAHAGEPLRKGPRGGGRDVDPIYDHVLGAEIAYAASIGARYKRQSKDKAPYADLVPDQKAVRKAFLQAVDDRVAGKPPPPSRRKKPLWPVRYAIRRSAWHALDHGWEIEDKLL